MNVCIHKFIQVPVGHNIDMVDNVSHVIQRDQVTHLNRINL